MNTLTDTPVAGRQLDLSVQPRAAAAAVAEIATGIATGVAPQMRKWDSRRVKDLLVMVYAYGLLGFGIFFPLLLAAWAAFFVPESG
ncbi:MAG TPA: hypothetical protein VIW27_09365 [Gammaproteobacteria bacterium]|jgi:hypothetical protein